MGALQGSKAQGSTGVRPWSANLLSVQQAQSKGLRQPLKNLEAQKYFEIPELIQYLRILGCSKLYKHYKKKKEHNVHFKSFIRKNHIIRKRCRGDLKHFKNKYFSTWHPCHVF